MATHSSVLAWDHPMDRGAWQAKVHGVTKSQTWLSTHTDSGPIAPLQSPREQTVALFLRQALDVASPVLKLYCRKTSSEVQPESEITQKMAHSLSFVPHA